MLPFQEGRSEVDAGEMPQVGYSAGASPSIQPTIRKVHCVPDSMPNDTGTGAHVVERDK